jgi:fructose-bisphosphate aldolase class 1
MQDPLVSQWGAQDRFQAHFIVKVDSTNPSKYVARTILKTSGHFNGKKIESVIWNGGALAEELNKDSVLNELISKQSVKDATIFVDPSNNGIRIYSKWKNSHEFQITKDMYAIYNKIAEHVKKI